MGIYRASSISNGFQSTPPRGGRRHPCAAVAHPASCFNPRPRAGGDSRGHWRRLYPSCFNPRPRAGGDHSNTQWRGEIKGFQSTPPRGGRRLMYPGSRVCGYVSIHAPARGATPPRPRPRRPGPVSIHAPARGATAGGRRGGVKEAVSIHAPARGATCQRRGHYRGWRVSIHAPARGATGIPCIPSRTIHSFNPRPRAGGDFESDRKTVTEIKFQSTPPRGGRHLGLDRQGNMIIVSIHAPARGATDFMLQPKEALIGFNPRPRAGGDGMP